MNQLFPGFRKSVSLRIVLSFIFYLIFYMSYLRIFFMNQEDTYFIFGGLLWIFSLNTASMIVLGYHTIIIIAFLFLISIISLNYNHKRSEHIYDVLCYLIMFGLFCSMLIGFLFVWSIVKPGSNFKSLDSILRNILYAFIIFFTSGLTAHSLRHDRNFSSESGSWMLTDAWIGAACLILTFIIFYQVIYPPRDAVQSPRQGDQ